jgi:hypothetical protein
VLRRLITVVVLACFTQPLFAQTATPLPTPTPDVSQMWTVEAVTNAAGTPFPAMDVVFRYQTNAGDIAITAFLAALLILIWIVFLWWLLIFREQK